MYIWSQKGTDKASEMRDREASLTNVFSVPRGGEQKGLLIFVGWQ